MDGRTVQRNDRALSRRVVARGVGGGAAALAALGFRPPAGAGGAQAITPSAAVPAVPPGWAAAWSSGDGAAVAALFAEDGVYEDVPFEARVTGRAAIAAHAWAYFDDARDAAFRSSGPAWRASAWSAAKAGAAAGGSGTAAR